MTKGKTKALRDDALAHLWMHNRSWDQTEQEEGPLVIVSGKGIHVTDSEGQEWMDVNGGYASVNVGYGRTEIAQAVYDQMCQIHYFPQVTVIPETVRFVSRIAELAPGSLSRVFPVSGGSLANETALKIARAYHHRRGEHGRYKIISRRGSYHGASGGVLWLGSVPSSPRTDYEPGVPGMLYAPQPHFYRCEYGSRSSSECAILCARAIEELIQFHKPETVAAVIAEPITSGPGAVVPGDEYWPMVREICDRYGVLLVMDEVITGFGRTGKLFASEHWGIVPDIMTVAKGISSCYLPLGATVVRSEVAEVFTGAGNQLHHVFTFSGHPVTAVAGLKNIEILLEEKMVENAETTGAYFKECLQELMEHHSLIGDVRGRGLMLAIELVSDRSSKTPLPPERKLTDRLNELFRAQGMLLRATGNIVHFSPPLCITCDEVDRVIAGVDNALKLLQKEWSG